MSHEQAAAFAVQGHLYGFCHILSSSEQICRWLLAIS